MQPLERRLDLVGIGLAAVAAAWVAIVAQVSGGRPAPAVALLAGSVAAVIVARHLPRARLLILALVAATPLIAAVVSRRPLLGAGPLGYANASGALFVVAAGSACTAGLCSRGAKTRIAGYLGAVAWLLIPWVSGALAASLLGTLVLVATVLHRRPGTARLALYGGAGATVVGLIIAIAAGFAHDARDPPGPLDRVLAATLTERRVALWSEAVHLVRAQPLTGVGPGRFREIGPVALGDRDAQWVHNEYLEMAVETGVPGMVLLMTLVGWGFLRLRRSVSDPRAVPAIVTLGATALHANIDYIWHFAVVPLALAALVGTALVVEDGRER